MTLLEYKAYLKVRKDILEELKQSLAEDCDINLNNSYKKIYKRRCKEKNLWNTQTYEFFKYLTLKGKVSLYHYIDNKINNMIGFTKYQIEQKE
jgi:hypothetical protein